MEQTKALNALEPFLALTKSASSPLAAADLITRATSHPNTFIFAELLQAPQIQALALAPPPQASHLSLLKIFSYGTYTDYTSSPTTLPALNPQQALKLRQLSLLTLARDPQNLSYDALIRALALDDPPALEALVTSAIYAGLVSGTLDPYNRLVSLSSVAPLRDLPPASIPSMLSTLDAWSARCVSTLAGLEAQIASVKADARRRQEAAAREREDMDKASEKQKMENRLAGGGAFSQVGVKLGAGAASKRGNGGLDRMGDGMDVDDGDDEDVMEAKEPRAAKKRTFFGKG